MFRPDSADKTWSLYEKTANTHTHTHTHTQSQSPAEVSCNPASSFCPIPCQHVQLGIKCCQSRYHLLSVKPTADRWQSHREETETQLIFCFSFEHAGSACCIGGCPPIISPPTMYVTLLSAPSVPDSTCVEISACLQLKSKPRSLLFSSVKSTVENRSFVKLHVCEGF